MRLLDLLYGSDEMLEKRMGGNSNSDIDSSSTMYPTATEEPFTSFMELPTTLGFTWADDLTKDDPNFAQPEQGLKYFAHFDAKHHQTTSVTGCKVHDIKSIYAYLRRHQRNMQQAGTIIMDTDNWAVEEEMGILLRRLVTGNHSREIRFGQRHCFEAWLKVIQVTVLDNFDFLPRIKRGQIIFIVLQKLLPMLTRTSLNGNGQDDGFLLQLARTILLCIGRLHKDGKAMDQQQSESTDSIHTTTTSKRLHTLSAESSLSLHRQLHDIFERTIKVIEDSTMTDDVRRTMYASAIHLVQTLSSENKATIELRQEMVKQLARLRSLRSLHPPSTKQPSESPAPKPTVSIV
jgi:hypothetical protein